MQNTILQLIEIIAALYFNSIAEDTDTMFLDEIRPILQNIKTDNRATIGFGSEGEAIESLKTTAEWLLCTQPENVNRANLITRLKVNLVSNNEFIDIAIDALDPAITVANARERSLAIMGELRHQLSKNELRDFIATANKKLCYTNDVIDTHEFVSGLMSGLEGFHSSAAKGNSRLIGQIDFSDEDSIEKALIKSKESISITGTLNTGFHGLNKAAGGYGFRRGDLINFAGLTHHYKSGILLDLSLLLPQNEPWMWDSTKKPMI